MKRELTEAEKEERIARDPLAQVIVELTKAMRADFGRQYASQFKTKDDLSEYKRRLYTKLRGFDINDIADAYEMYVNSGKTFIPTIPELIELSHKAAKIHRKKQQYELETKKLAQLPAPTIECNPLKMLSEAKNNIDSHGTTGVSIIDKLEAHERLLRLHYNKIAHAEIDDEHRCVYPGCKKAGTLSDALTGGGNMYCRDHYALKK